MLSQQPPWMLVLSTIGILSLLKPVILLLRWVLITFLREPKNLKECYGSWAVITGSTDGIGKAFAFELAKKGLNLILVSRNMEKLKQVCIDVSAVYPKTETKIFVIDFNGAVGEVRDGIEEMMKVIEGLRLEVGVLVNNVGVTYRAARYFHEVEEQVWMNVVRVNIEGTSLITRAVLPGMLRRKRGAIVNIGSGAALVLPSHPLFAVYAATKAYIDQFSRCLNVEYKHHGIDVQCQVPLYVSTKMASRIASVEKSSIFVPTPEKYAGVAIRHIGYEARCIPYWSHSLQWFFASLLPQSLLDAWRLSIGIRRRANTNPNPNPNSN